VLFAILVFALLGIAALCVDLGFASLAQSQMQTAADTAALEGVRLRDYHEYRSFGAPYVRPRVSELVRQVFDDDMHPTLGVVAPVPAEQALPGAPMPPGALAPDDEDALKLGAGPIYRLSDGIGPSNVSAELTAPERAARTSEESWVDDPILEVNKFNRANGDMLTGTYSPSSAHGESADYVRGDFAPATYTADPTLGYQAIGFLVRMRRTSGADALDHAAGVSSHGATLPLLFGMGAPIQSDASASYDPRRDGLTVRATAIAVGRPALSIGPPLVDSVGAPLKDRVGKAIHGVGYWYFPSGTVNPSARRHVTIAWDKNFWANDFESILVEHVPIPNESQTLTVLASGAIELNPGARIVGHLMVAACDFATSNDVCSGTTGTTLGMAVGANLSQPPYFLTQANLEDILEAAGSDADLARCYMPLYAPISAPDGTITNRIIAFSYGKLVGKPIGTPKFSVTKGWDGGADEPGCWVLVAPDNTSGVLSPRAPTLTTSEWTQIFDQNQQFAYPNGNATYDWRNVRPGTALTPVLAR
jgi:hypothetical protein